MMVLGALQALRQAGRSVPGDVAVIGLDDAPAAVYADPSLSAVCQPILRMGRELARLILWLGSGEPAEDHTILPAELVLLDTA